MAELQMVPHLLPHRAKRETCNRCAVARDDSCATIAAAPSVMSMPIPTPKMPAGSQISPDVSPNPYQKLTCIICMHNARHTTRSTHLDCSNLLYAASNDPFQSYYMVHHANHPSPRKPNAYNPAKPSKPTHSHTLTMRRLGTVCLTHTW